MSLLFENQYEYISAEVHALILTYKSEVVGHDSRVALHRFRDKSNVITTFDHLFDNEMGIKPFKIVKENRQVVCRLSFTVALWVSVPKYLS